MTKKDPVQTAKQRAYRYWHIDGLAEIGLGLFCLLLGLYFYAQATVSQTSPLYTFIDASLLLVMVGGGLLINRLVSWAKARLTYPRTGYVAYPQPRRGRRWIGATIAIGMGFLISALLASAPASLDWMPAITGFLFAAVLVFLGLRVDLLRFYLLAVLSLGLGLGLSLAGVGNTLGLAIFYALAGLLLVLSGGMILLQYLRSAQPAEAAGL